MKSRIVTFWEWFADWQDDVAAAYASDDARWLDANLTAQVKRIQAQLNWEIGPYHDPENTLVISPSARDNIETNRVDGMVLVRGISHRLDIVAPEAPTVCLPQILCPAHAKCRLLDTVRRRVGCR